MEQELEELKTAKKNIKRFIRKAKSDFESVFEELLEHELTEAVDEIEVRIHDLNEMIKESQEEVLNY